MKFFSWLPPAPSPSLARWRCDWNSRRKCYCLPRLRRQHRSDPGIKLDPNSGFSGACLRSGQSVRCDDSDTDSRVNAQACRALGTRSMIAVPLSAKKRVVGLIEAFSTETFGFNDSDERSLNLLGELILAAIRPEEEDRLAELAEHIVVPETGLPPDSRPSEAPAATPHVPAKIIVDEKFVPPVVTPRSSFRPTLSRPS